jgi:hypothetical protein
MRKYCNFKIHRYRDFGGFTRVGHHAIPISDLCKSDSVSMSVRVCASLAPELLGEFHSYFACKSLSVIDVCPVIMDILAPKI